MFVCVEMSRKDTIGILGQLDRTPPDVRTPDRLSMNNIAIKQRQSKHTVDHNDDGTDDDGVSALHAVVNEEQAKVYDPM